MNLKIIISIIIVLFSLTFSWATNAQGNVSPKHLSSGYIFEQKITNNCHAATLEEVSDDTIMAAWFGGAHEGAKDVGIYTSTYDGNKWSAPIAVIQPLISKSDTLPCWNPVLFKSNLNRLYLFYKVGKNPREWFGAMVTSDNNGKSWSKPSYLPKGFWGPIKNKPIQLIDGTIICGSSTESINSNEWRVHVELYDEIQHTWKHIKVKNKNKFEVIQPTFIKHADNKIQMLCRSKHNKVIESWSLNKGKSWSNLDSINVVNSNSGIDAVALHNGLFLLVNNPLKQGPDWFYGRNILDVEYSMDGKGWTKLLDLENEEKGEFSYPAIIQTSDNKIHILYTYNREFIKHTQFSLDI